jgi:hypothetical protein
MTRKRCGKCGQGKPLAEFYPDASHKDGVHSECRSCALDQKRREYAHYPERAIWKAMVARCHNERSRDYHYYGARGITVCERWRSDFANFLADMGPRPSPQHTIERKANDQNYAPENCRWATRLEQGRNSRRNRLITAQGRTQCLSAWSEEVGIQRITITARLARGWSPERALFTSPQQKRRAA